MLAFVCRCMMTFVFLTVLIHIWLFVKAVNASWAFFFFLTFSNVQTVFWPTFCVCVHSPAHYLSCDKVADSDLVYGTVRRLMLDSDAGLPQRDNTIKGVQAHVNKHMQHVMSITRV